MIRNIDANRNYIRHLNLQSRINPLSGQSKGSNEIQNMFCLDKSKRFLKYATMPKCTKGTISALGAPRTHS